MYLVWMYGWISDGGRKGSETKGRREGTGGGRKGTRKSGQRMVNRPSEATKGLGKKEGKERERKCKREGGRTRVKSKEKLWKGRIVQEKGTSM